MADRHCLEPAFLGDLVELNVLAVGFGGEPRTPEKIEHRAREMLIRFACDLSPLRRRVTVAEGRFQVGERDSVPGEALAEVARSAGAEVIEIRTECFV